MLFLFETVVGASFFCTAGPRVTYVAFTGRNAFGYNTGTVGAAFGVASSYSAFFARGTRFTITMIVEQNTMVGTIDVVGGIERDRNRDGRQQCREESDHCGKPQSKKKEEGSLWI